MREPIVSTKQFEFYFPDLDTRVLVEECEDEVVVSATRNAFSELRKIFFVRELAAEGFIPDEYQGFSGFGAMTWLRVRWLVDTSWVKANEVQAALARRFMMRLFVSATLLWFVLMTALFLR